MTEHHLTGRGHRTAAEVALLRSKISEGIASGVIDLEPEDVLDQIIAEDPALKVLA